MKVLPPGTVKVRIVDQRGSLLALGYTDDLFNVVVPNVLLEHMARLAERLATTQTTQLSGDDVTELQRLMRAVTDDLTSLREESAITARVAGKSSYRMFWIGLALAIPVGLVGSFIAYMLGIS